MVDFVSYSFSMLVGEIWDSAWSVVIHNSQIFLKVAVQRGIPSYKVTMANDIPVLIHFILYQ